MGQNKLQLSSQHRNRFGLEDGAVSKCCTTVHDFLPVLIEASQGGSKE